MQRFADVIVDISLEKLDKPFQYKIPEKLEAQVKVGSQVVVPFGNGSRTLSGYVIDIKEEPSIDINRIKDIIEIKLGSLEIESQLIALAWFINQHYGATMNKSLKTVIPIKKSVKDIENRFVKIKVKREEALELYQQYSSRKNTQKRAELIKELMDSEGIDYDVIKEKLGISDSIIKAMTNNGILEIEKSKKYRNPLGNIPVNEKNVVLNDQQQFVADEIINDLDNARTHIIFGVTGSGKTEVYMEIIDKVLKQGKEAIVLIPEIALTYQTIKRFYGRFGDVVSIINSKLSAGEKYDQFERAKNGQVKVMIGPRSALFTPFKNLGIIVIDEEHEGAYKSEQVPKYHARDVAIYRAGLCGATVVLGSATPSLDTFYKAKQGKYVLHRLNKRAGDRALAKVDIVDMRKELEAGNRDIFSMDLKKKIKDRLDKKEQAMLFLNRRGYSSFVSCRKCGNTIKCPHCDVSLTLHKRRSGDKLVCHYCGYSEDMPKLCPKCQSKYIGGFGIGTEQIEKKIMDEFPEARVLRMDMDTTRGKDDYENILSSFSSHEADILIGTQMIVKGHDFPGVTLVGIVAADLTLFASDYMAGEKTFELLTQAAGRAGRGERPGEVVIQTYNPEEACIVFSAEQNYEKFYQDEMAYRQLMTYPPVYGMIAILISDKNEEFAWRATKDIALRIEKSKIENLTMIGPSKATISKINDIYRNVIYIKHPEEETLIKVKNAIQKYVDMVEEYSGLGIQFDYNPMNAY